MLLYIPGVNHFRTKCHTSSANVPYSPTLLCHVYEGVNHETIAHELKSF